MPRRQFTGLGDIRFAVGATAVANIAAPTVAEITAAVRLTPYMTRNGLKRPQSGNTVDVADASSLFNKTGPGTYGGDALEYTGHRDSKGSDDDAWTTLPRGTIGFWIITDWGWAQAAGTGLGTSGGTPTIGDRCEVWPGTIISREPADTGENESNKFVARSAVTDEPNLDAVVA